MTATHSATAAAVDPDYEAYQTVVRLVSNAVSDGILKGLGQLQDPTVFTNAVQQMAAAQGVSAASLSDPMDLYNGFWTLANGVAADLHWRSSSGVPARSAMIAKSIEPSQQPVALSGGAHASGSIGLSAFGIGLGIEW
ncbi:hypothetical protein [Streptomyces sp. YIM B13508]|uniref:hypothetical protein n=1 Tax=Streptomyces sp. YIM B13508 TaxID=3366315 RepID=UPI003675EBCF